MSVPSPGQPGGIPLGLFVAGKTGLETGVGGPEADRPGVGGQVPLRGADEALPTGRLVQPGRHVGHARRRVVGDDEGKHGFIGRRGAGREAEQGREQDDEAGTHEG